MSRMNTVLRIEIMRCAGSPRRVKQEAASRRSGSSHLSASICLTGALFRFAHPAAPTSARKLVSLTVWRRERFGMRNRKPNATHATQQHLIAVRLSYFSPRARVQSLDAPAPPVAARPRRSRRAVEQVPLAASQFGAATRPRKAVPRSRPSRARRPALRWATGVLLAAAPLAAAHWRLARATTRRCYAWLAPRPGTVLTACGVELLAAGAGSSGGVRAAPPAASRRREAR